MADINIARKHSLGKDEAKKRANDMLDKMKDKVGIKGTWAGDVFNVTDPVKGTFTVSESEIKCELNLSFMMKAMKGMIEQKINESFDKALA
jgi:putative polyhydroxyalkanoate system protein